MLTDITEINREKWLDLLCHSSFRSPFQSPEFYDVYNSLEGQRADVFVLEEAGEYVALVLVTVQREKGLKAYFSRRGIVYGGILVRSSANQLALNFLVQHLTLHYRRQLIYLEIRNNFDYSDYHDVFRKARFNYVPWLNIQFSNVSTDTFKSQMSKVRQRQLKKAFGNGVSWREASSLEDVKQFYTILSGLYKSKVKKPLPEFSYFKNLYQSTFAQCLLVDGNQGIIGGVMCPFSPKDTLYELYICGLDKDNPDLHPSIFAMWAMVEYAEQNHIPSIDLMGSGQPGIPSTVRDFKSKFGGKTVENGRFLRVYNKFLYGLGRCYINYAAKRR